MKRRYEEAGGPPHAASRTGTTGHLHRDRLLLSIDGYPPTLSGDQNDYVEEGFSRKGHSYKPLPLEFHSHGFSYRQIARQGDWAIYAQGCQDSENVCYEVVRIRRQEAKTFPSGRSYPAREVYPASETWGTAGFTFADSNKAWDKFFEISLEEPAMKGKEVN